MFFNLFALLAVAICSTFSLMAENNSLSSHYEIAKEQCHDISCIRREIDQINEEILKLLAKRTAYVKRAGDLKLQTTRIAQDLLRVAIQEQKIIERSIELEVPLEISISTFRAIVDNSVLFQQSYIDKSLKKQITIN